MSYTALVLNDRAFTSRAGFAGMPLLDATDGELMPLFGLPPKFIYRVDDGDFHALATDPVEVHLLTRDRRSATVEVVPVVA